MVELCANKQRISKKQKKQVYKHLLRPLAPWRGGRGAATIFSVIAVRRRVVISRNGATSAVMETPARRSFQNLVRKRLVSGASDNELKRRNSDAIGRFYDDEISGLLRRHALDQESRSGEEIRARFGENRHAVIVSSLQLHAKLAALCHLSISELRGRVFIKHCSASRYVACEVSTVSLFCHNVSASATHVPVVSRPLAIGISEGIDLRMSF